jgi:hypothetical protein
VSIELVERVLDEPTRTHTLALTNAGPALALIVDLTLEDCVLSSDYTLTLDGREIECEESHPRDTLQVLCELGDLEAGRTRTLVIASNGFEPQYRATLESRFTPDPNEANNVLDVRHPVPAPQGQGCAEGCEAGDNSSDPNCSAAIVLHSPLHWLLVLLGLSTARRALVRRAR